MNRKNVVVVLLLVTILTAACRNSLTTPTTGMESVPGDISAPTIGSNPSTFTNDSDTVDEAAVIQNNLDSQQRLDALINEVAPFVIGREDGSITIAPGAPLSPEAAVFAAEAERAAAQFKPDAGPTEQNDRPGYHALASGGVNKIVCAWWGCSIYMTASVVSSISAAWFQSGGNAAIKQFVLCYAASAWAVSIASVLVTTYIITAKVVNYQGGNRGVIWRVPWSVVPTVVVSQ